MCLCVCSAGAREETGHLQPGADVCVCVCVQLALEKKQGHLQPGADVCVCVCVQLALEKKQGISNLELMCVFVCVFSWL